MPDRRPFPMHAIPLMALVVAVLLSPLWPLGAGLAAQERDGAFQAWLRALWPEAQAIGISRATFDRATAGLTPDLTLPDLVLAGRPPRPSAGQAEFVQTPAAYLSDKAIAGAAGRGRALLAQHRQTLAAIERRFRVPAEVVLAIYGRETGYGTAPLRYGALRVLATQAFTGRRRDEFRQEFLLALKMVEDGEATPGEMRSSWAGAMGLAQVLPSHFQRYAVDFDGDGRRNVFTSLPDALATVANHLSASGWRAGERWAYEVKLPAALDCTIADPEKTMRLGEWLQRGFVLADGTAPGASELRQEVSLLLPAGPYGPGFLIGTNYFVIKDYNFSDLYVLFVGHLADRIAGKGPFATPWGKVVQPTSVQMESAQKKLAALGLYRDRIDGKAGMKTRLAIGAYQSTQGLDVDCWPNTQTLNHLRIAAP